MGSSETLFPRLIVNWGSETPYRHPLCSDHCLGQFSVQLYLVISQPYKQLATSVCYDVRDTGCAGTAVGIPRTTLQKKVIAKLRKKRCYRKIF